MNTRVRSDWFSVESLGEVRRRHDDRSEKLQVGGWLAGRNIIRVGASEEIQSERLSKGTM